MSDNPANVIYRKNGEIDKRCKAYRDAEAKARSERYQAQVLGKTNYYPAIKKPSIWTKITRFFK